MAVRQHTLLRRGSDKRGYQILERALQRVPRRVLRRCLVVDFKGIRVLRRGS